MVLWRAPFPFFDDECERASTYEMIHAHAYPRGKRGGTEKRESPCDRSTWYINARVSVRVNSQRGKNVKCSSFTRRCVVINNNGRVNYCARAGDVRTITGA